MRSTRDNAALSLHTSVDKAGPVTGATVRVSLKRNDVENSWLDFGVTPKVFKTSAWTNRYLALTEAGDIPGFYEKHLDMSLDFTLPAAVDSVIPLFEITAPAESVGVGAGEEIFFDDKVDALNNATQAPTAAANATATWDALRSAHTDAGSFGEFTGDATMRGTDGANTVVPMTAALSQTEHDDTQSDIAALVTPPHGAAIADAWWDEDRAAHSGAGSFGENTGDAAMRGTDGANTVVPLAAATDQAEHDATQADIAALMPAATHQAEHDATQAAIAAVPTAAEIDTELTGTHGAGAWTTGAGASPGDVADAVWDEARGDHTGAGSFGEFTGDATMRGTDGVDTATMRGTDGANTTTPPTVGEIDTELIIAHGAGNWEGGGAAPTVDAIADGVWDELRAGHTDAGSFGEFTGDATMRGTDGANTTTPLAAAADTAAHDQTQTDIAALPTDASIAAEVDTVLTAAHGSGSWAGATAAAVATAVWSETLPGAFTGTDAGAIVEAIRLRLDRLDTLNIQTKLFYAVDDIDTGTRRVPAEAASHMSVESRLDGAAFTGTAQWYVWFTYAEDATKDDGPASSTVPTVAATAPPVRSRSTTPRSPRCGPARKHPARGSCP